MKSESIKYRCGCVAVPQEITIKEESKYRKIEYSIKVWTISTHCSKHYPNYQKKADKLIHRRKKVGGRGFTKSPKPLKERK
jgi:hypothetical protein